MTALHSHHLTHPTAAFHSMPIRIKLLLIIVGTCTMALLLSASFETLLDWNGQRQLIMNRLALTAEVFALQARAPLEFLDTTAAHENLASLQADPVIRKACLYNETGTLFTSYLPVDNTAAPETLACPPASAARNSMHWNRLAVVGDVMHGEHRLGSIYLERSLSDVNHHFVTQSLYKLIIILVVIMLMWKISGYFQRTISQPVIRLADLARQFSQDRTRAVKVIKTGDDELGELVDAFNDMTEEIRRNERQLEQAIAELTRSNTELERFAHICSHDLQEPLRMVSNYAALLERSFKDKLDDDTKQYLHFVTDGAMRMRELVNDILAYSRIGHQLEPVQRVDLGELTDYVLQNLGASIIERHARIHKADLPIIAGNRTLLAQIFQNLIGNAVKFCNHTPEVWITAVRRAGAWEFSVRDNGIGIDPKYHSKIFEIFRRLNRREEFRGTGIGLAIVKKAVAYHGGEVWVESEVGKGTTFFFTVPDQSLKEN